MSGGGGEPGAAGGSGRSAFGREALGDLLGDHVLMRSVIIHCIDNAWYGGGAFVSRVHFDTADLPERRNVFLIRNALSALESHLSAPGTSVYGEFGRAAWGRVFERLCSRDAVVAFDGEHWAPMRVEECVSAMSERFVEAVSDYIRESGGRVRDVLPAMEDLLDDYRLGRRRAYLQLSEAVAVILDKHAASADEFLSATGPPRRAPAAEGPRRAPAAEGPRRAP